MKNKTLVTMIVLVVLSLIGFYVIGYSVFTIDLATGEAVDGFGRKLYEKPFWVSLFLSDEPTWRGFMWHLFDVIVFWIGLGLIYVLAKSTD